MGWLSRFFPKTVAEFRSEFNQDIKVIEKNKKTSLRVNGVEQSGAYVAELFRQAFQKFPIQSIDDVRHILVFGVGGGIVLKQLRSLCPKAHITGVDIDKKIIDIGKTYFDLGHMENSSFIVSDARTFVRKNTKKRFDLVIIDLYVGNHVPQFVTQKTFLHNVKKLIQPGGRLVINYFSFRDQPQKAAVVHKRLRALFIDVMMEQNLRNIFFYCWS